ncbi:DUF3107 domain-containing protein [Mariniluteicoccus endophyticus]
MEVKVGIQHIARELSVETEQTADEVEQAYTKALAEDSLFTLVDSKGGRTLVRASSVAYLDLGKENVRRVGFGAV